MWTEEQQWFWACATQCTWLSLKACREQPNTCWCVTQPFCSVKRPRAQWGGLVQSLQREEWHSATQPAAFFKKVNQFQEDDLIKYASQPLTEKLLMDTEPLKRHCGRFKAFSHLVYFDKLLLTPLCSLCPPTQAQLRPHFDQDGPKWSGSRTHRLHYHYVIPLLWGDVVKYDEAAKNTPSCLCRANILEQEADGVGVVFLIMVTN